MIKPYLMIPYVGAIMVVATTSMMIYFINPPGPRCGGDTGVGISSAGKIGNECSPTLLVLPSVGNGICRREDGRGQRSRWIQACDFACHNQHHHSIRLCTIHRRRLTKFR